MSVTSMFGVVLFSVAIVFLFPAEAAAPAVPLVTSAALLRREAFAPDSAIRPDVSMASLEEETGSRSDTLAGTCCNRNRETAVDSLNYLPKMQEFRRLWSGKMELDRMNPHFKDSVRKDLKIVMGLMSFAHEYESRHVIRETWMQQPGVCAASKGPKDDCAFYVVFVVGGGNNKTKDDDSMDLMHVQDEKPTIFKIKAFMRRIIDEFPWATHYGKMDSDTFPHIYRLLPKVPMPTSTCEVYFGATIPSHGCGLTMINEESAGKKMKYACMHGSLYIFSRKLTMGMVEKGGTVDDWFSGKHGDITSEDLNFGIALTEHVRKTKMCLNIKEAYLKDNPGGLWDHCGVNCKSIESTGSFR